MPVETTENYIRIRIKPKTKYDKNSFRTITFGEGIKAIIACPKGYYKAGVCTTGTQVKTLLFPRSKYTEKEAKQWIKTHPKIKVKKKK